ncbi:hypothetical protein TNCV_2504711 [Trichonephila clavipes]|uniref:Uncharacterized protein n=1 Tax=Trichonephila clavipes TaxID=2585209 RepID=A0A8X6WFU7_TRICX|nr:hypothetical protein TNCV_2504711 [Trichonephila clavipes]
MRLNSYFKLPSSPEIATPSNSNQLLISDRTTLFRLTDDIKVKQRFTLSPGNHHETHHATTQVTSLHTDSQSRVGHVPSHLRRGPPFLKRIKAKPNFSQSPDVTRVALGGVERLLICSPSVTRESIGYTQIYRL